MLSEQEKVYVGKLKVMENITTADKMLELFKNVNDAYKCTFFVYDGEFNEKLNDNQVLIVGAYNRTPIFYLRRRSGFNVASSFSSYYDTVCNVGDTYKIYGCN